jgi:hypothetical protein
MKRAFVALLLAASASWASENDALWSAPVNGLRARLTILPAEKPGSPFCRVMIEMQNVDDVAGQKKIRFSPECLALHVADGAGRELPVSSGPYDGMSPQWEPTLLPYAGTIRFQVSFPGLGYRSTDKVIVDVGPSKAWIVPQDASAYFLSGKLIVEKRDGDHPHMDWSGELALPKIEIPRPKTEPNQATEDEARKVDDPGR